MANLLKNPGFENGLDAWTSTNVYLYDFIQFEGTASAQMGPGIANLFQDVPSDPMHVKPKSYLFSFALAGLTFSPGDIRARVVWLDAQGNDLGTGLEIYVPSFTMDVQFLWLTQVGVTAAAPSGVATVRVEFSKASGLVDGIALVDQVVLSPLA
jgi:hypothetical protein